MASVPSNLGLTMHEAMSVEEILRHLDFYRDQRKMEYDLLAARMTWYVTCQSFMLTAYAVSFVNSPRAENWFSCRLLPALGIGSTILALPAIYAAIWSVRAWKIMNRFLIHQVRSRPDVAGYLSLRDTSEWEDRAWHSVSMFFPVLIPLLFGIAWAILGAQTASNPWAWPRA